MLDDFHRRQSQESVYFRFFRYRPELSDKELDYFTNIDYDARMAFVAIVGGVLVAVARYESWDSPRHQGQRVGEVAFFTDDAHHGKGLATLLLEYLAAAARRNGMDRFTATVLPANFNMLRVFRRAGFEVSTRFEDGAIEVDLGIAVTDEANAAIETRDRVSQARSIQRLLQPRSIAIVGASRTPGSVGHELVRNVLGGSFPGEIHLINDGAAEGESLLGHPLRRSILDVPVMVPTEELADSPPAIDLAVIVVPAASVQAVVEDCVAAGVHGLVVISAGFRESGPVGRGMEQRLVTLARHNGMRLIGPNSFGFFNTDPRFCVNAVFVPMDASAGTVGLVSESGPLGAALVQQLRSLDVGLSTFVAVGNRADVSINDLLHYWAEDDGTKVVALYLENFGNLRNFTAIAQHLSIQKPIIAVAPHDEELADLLAQSGIILVDEVAQLAQQCRLVVDQPMPLGSRVAIVSNTSSVARLAAGACRRAGLEPVVPSSLAQVPAADVVLVGDLDTMRLPEGATAQTYEQIVVAAAFCDEVDAVLLALVPTLDVSIGQLAELLHQVNRAVPKPMVATGLVDSTLLTIPGLPAFTFPEEAAQALGRMAKHACWRTLRRGDPIQASSDMRGGAHPALHRALGGISSRHLSLRDPDLPALLAALELPIVEFRAATTVEDVVAFAEEIGYPVVLKGGGLLRRSVGESGGVALDLQNADQLTGAFERMLGSFGKGFLPAIVQTSVPTGTHLQVGLRQSSDHGARLMVGIGGSSVGALATQSRIVLPTSEPALDLLLGESWLVEAVPSTAARFGLRHLLAGLASAADASPDLAEVRCNPVLVAGEMVHVVDIDLYLRPWPRDPLAEVRHLEGL